MKTLIIQKAIVRREDGKILILRRSSSDTRRPLQWDLPGGQYEPGEEMIKGVEREIKEESGLNVSGTTAIYSKTEHRKWSDGEASAVFIFYVAKASSDKVKLSFEHSEYRWLSISEAIKVFEYPLHLELFNYVQQHDLLA